MSTSLPPRPTRIQLKGQARLLESFGPASAPVEVAEFVSRAKPLATSYLLGTAAREELGQGWDAGLRAKDKQKVVDECGLADLVEEGAKVYGDPNLISGLRQYQHELATPFGSLHSIHSIEKTAKDEQAEAEEEDEHERQLQQPLAEEERPKKKQRKNKGKAHEVDDIVVDAFDPQIDPSLQPDIPTDPTKRNGSSPTPAAAWAADEDEKLAMKRRVRKKKAGPRVPLAEKQQPMRDLVRALESTGLKLLQPTSETRFYVRSVARPDFNILADRKYTHGLQTSNPSDPPAILTITFHPVVRSAVFAGTSAQPLTSTADHKAVAPRLQTVHVLSSQTLADLKDAIACPADFIPVELDRGELVDVSPEEKASQPVGASGKRKGEVVGPVSTMMVYRRGKWERRRWDAGAVFGVEGKLYADRRDLAENPNKLDYAQLVVDLYRQATAPSAENGTPSLPVVDQVPFEVSPKGMEETAFEDLRLRLGEPYWMFHQGSCEHIWTVDEIRCLHADDPSPFAAVPVPEPAPAPEPEDHPTPRRRNTRRRPNHPPPDPGHSPVPDPPPPPRTATTASLGDGYPITTFLSRSSSAKCRICDRDPASMVVVDDELAGDSPCYVCEKCFEMLHAHEGPDDGGRPPYWIVPLMPEG